MVSPDAIESAIQCSDYATLASVFSSQWPSLSGSDQRTLASKFVTSSMASPNFYPAAFKDSSIIDCVIPTALKHLPTTVRPPPVPRSWQIALPARPHMYIDQVENGADNILRQKIFDYLVEDGDYSTAAKVLGAMRMEDMDSTSVYYMSPVERADV
ncbi:hypothetical protein THAOC_29540, partial [Thalassiosira oceanica]